MKLYRAKIPVVAKEIVERLCNEGDIEVAAENREEAERDFAAIMEEYVRRDMDLRNQIRDYMARRKIPYDQYGRTRTRLAEELGHPLGDDVDRFLARQFVENLMITRFVDEIYEEDEVMYKKLIEILRSHNVDERAIREEARNKIKNVQEGTVDYEVALQKAIK
ncbi:MAG: DUF507 family protein, partial [Proteobacteria bacterium]|nr:DUF507 family protein [Pseudomonadota bacterium]